MSGAGAGAGKDHRSENFLNILQEAKFALLPGYGEVPRGITLEMLVDRRGTGAYSHVSLLWLLVASPSGLGLLENTGNRLLNSLDATILSNAPTKGADAGKPILWLISKSISGRAFLRKRWYLLMGVSAEALMMAPKTGEYAGKSALWYLSSDAASCAFVMGSNAIFECVTDDMLIEPLIEGGDFSYSLLWRLVKNLDKNFIKHSVFMERLTVEMLAMAPAVGECAGETILWYLCSIFSGRNFLLSNLDLWKQVSIDMLRAAPLVGENAGRTSLLTLSYFSTGCQLLKHHDLPASVLMESAGIGGFAGISPLQQLCVTKHGRELLKTDTMIRETLKPSELDDAIAAIERIRLRFVMPNLDEVRADLALFRSQIEPSGRRWSRRHALVLCGLAAHDVRENDPTRDDRLLREGDTLVSRP